MFISSPFVVAQSVNMIQFIAEEWINRSVFIKCYSNSCIKQTIPMSKTIMMSEHSKLKNITYNLIKRKNTLNNTTFYFRHNVLCSKDLKVANTE